MADLSQVPHVAQHVVHHAAVVKPLIVQGYSMLSVLAASAASLAAGFGLGWYVKGRGLTGVQNDINNIKQDIENLKAKFSAPVAA